MGLDIYKYKISKERVQGEFAPNRILKSTFSDSKNGLDFFKKFKKYIILDDVEYYDIENFFIQKNINIDDYNLFIEDSSVFTFVNKITEERLTIKHNDPEFKTIQEEAIYMKIPEIGYQRKGMKKEFYSEFLNGCWYIAGAEKKFKDCNEDIYFILDNTQLNYAKTFVEDKECALYNWELRDDEFIYLSY